MTRFHLESPPPDTPPLDPSAAHAREQLAQELAKVQYAAARPSGLSLLIQQLEDWFNSLFDHASGSFAGGSGIILVVVGAVVVAAIVVGFLVFGLPRINRRSAVTGALFGDEDDRDSRALRVAAERAAAAGDFGTAILEGFRAIARGLAERLVVVTFPGTTAHSFAIQASVAFPGFRRELSRSADSFDAVRYLGATGTEDDWMVVAALEAALRATRPELEEAAL